MGAIESTHTSSVRSLKEDLLDIEKVY